MGGFFHNKHNLWGGGGDVNSLFFWGGYQFLVDVKWPYFIF